MINITALLTSQIFNFGIMVATATTKISADTINQ